MSNRMPAGEFKAKCLSIMEKVRRTRRSVIITKRNIPIAELKPLGSDSPSLFGCMKDSVKFRGDVTKPLGEEWDANS